MKYNEDYSTKLIETTLVHKIYDFESYHELEFIFLKTATLSTYYFNNPRSINKLHLNKINLHVDYCRAQNKSPIF